MTREYLDALEPVEHLEPNDQFIHETDCPYVVLLFEKAALQSPAPTHAAASAKGLERVLQR